MDKNQALDRVIARLDETYGKDYRSPEIDFVKKVIEETRNEKPNAN